MQEVFIWLGLYEKYNIKYWPLGGDIMSGLDLSVFSERNQVFAIVDADPGSSTQRTRFIRKCNSNQIPCYQLKRYSIENYFAIKAIRKIFPNQIPRSITQLDPNKSVDEQIGFKDKNKSIKAKNRYIIKEMNLSDLEGTDLLEYLRDIANKLQSSSNDT